MATSYSTDKAIPWIYVTTGFLVAQLPLLILMKVIYCMGTPLLWRTSSYSTPCNITVMLKHHENLSMHI